MSRAHARAAFALGYAEVPIGAFPVRDHTQAVLLTVLDFAEANPDAPALLDVVRKVGRREGLQTTLNRRQDDVEAKYKARLRPLLRQVGQLIARSVVAALPAPIDAVQHNPDAQSIVQEAITALQDMGLWQEWRQVTRDAITDGLAEGRMAGLAWLAHEKGAVLPDFGITLPQQITALQNLGELPGWNTVDSWQGKQVEGIAYQIGRGLAAAQAGGATGDDMVALIESEIEGDSSYAYLLLNDAIGASTILGRLMVYGEEGVMQVEMLISPEACEICEELAVGSPFNIGDAPQVPVHPNCRCDLLPVI